MHKIASPYLIYLIFLSHFFSCLTKPGSEHFIFISRDGRVLAAGGRSRFIHLWDLDTHRLLRIVELPTKVTSVKQLNFLPDKFDAGQNQVIISFDLQGT